MVKNKSKKQSKRQPARLRYKIEKKVRDHNKKLRRDLKKKPKSANKPKVIQIPNICPFKEDILKEVEQLKKQKDEEKQKLREAARLEKMSKNKAKENAKNEGGLEKMVENAAVRGNIHEAFTPTNGILSEHTKNSENSLKAYYKEFRKVVDAADVVLEIVDARDPLGTRCMQVEQAVTEAKGNKRLVIVINKADLVPRETLDAWIKHLRKSFPTIPFKASTQAQTRKLGRKKMSKNKQDIQGSNCIGAELLMSLLANYCRNKGIKTSIRVGVVGLPNVGKSSIINSLKRSRACNVGAIPGVTRAMQEVQLDSKIKLLDSPGIVFAAGNDASASLRNAVRTSALDDPVTPANAILQRVDKRQMMEMYNVPDYKSPDEFYSLKASRSGKFKKGGIPDSISAARGLLDDWNMGKIKYYTVPPEDNSADAHVSAEIVSASATEFDLENYDALVASVVDSLPKEIGGHFAVDSLGVCKEAKETQEEEEAMEEDKAVESEVGKEELLKANVAVKPANKKAKGKGVPRLKKVDPEMEIEGNKKLNKIKKMQFKKQKKDLKRRQKAEKAAGQQISEGLEKVTVTKTSANYDFDADFNMQ